MNDTLAAALSNILNAEKVSREFCIVRPSSKITKKVLDLMNEHGYIGSYEEINDGRGKVLKINLIGKVNNTGVIKPRFYVKKNDFEKFEKRFLPARDFGFLVVSTSKGIMTNDEAKKKGIGGRLLSFVY